MAEERAYHQGQFVAFVVRSPHDDRVSLSTGRISLLGSNTAVIHLVDGRTVIVPVSDLRPFPSTATPMVTTGPALAASSEDRQFWLAVCGSWEVPERDSLTQAADAAMLDEPTT